MKHWTISWFAALAVAFLSANAAHGAILLTGLCQFIAGPTGATGAHFWNTLGSDGVFNLYVIDSYDIDGSFINTGNAAATSINVPLTVGTHEFTIYGQPGSAGTDAGLNLFFNGAVAPAISVFAPHNSNNFAANFNTSTRSLTGGVIAGAGTLSFTADDLTVSLTDYIWSSAGQTLGTRDRVQGFNNVAGVGNDLIGQFTLVVVPEPATILLFSLAAGMVLLHRGRGFLAFRRDASANGFANVLRQCLGRRAAIPSGSMEMEGHGVTEIMFRGCRYAQPPANHFDPSGIG